MPPSRFSTNCSLRSWVDDLDVQVRIGIHSGYPTSTETNYVGMDVNTASRITAVGHGGQVLVSANTREGVMSSAPGGGIRFKALGTHKLRGLPEARAAVPGRGQGPPDRASPRCARNLDHACPTAQGIT